MNGNIIFIMGSVSVAAVIAVDVMKTMRAAKARRALHRDAGSSDYDRQPDGFINLSASGGHPGVVDFAALMDQPIKNWEHVAGDPTPRPLHGGYPLSFRGSVTTGRLHGDGSISSATMVMPDRRFYVSPGPMGKPGEHGYYVLDHSDPPRAFGPYAHRKSALRKARQMNAVN